MSQLSLSLLLFLIKLFFCHTEIIDLVLLNKQFPEFISFRKSSAIARVFQEEMVKSDCMRPVNLEEM